MIRIKMNFSTGCDDAVREAITQSGINNGASTHICVRKTDQDEEIWIKLINLAYVFAYLNDFSLAYSTKLESKALDCFRLKCVEC